MPINVNRERCRIRSARTKLDDTDSKRNFTSLGEKLRASGEGVGDEKPDGPRPGLTRLTSTTRIPPQRTKKNSRGRSASRLKSIAPFAIDPCCQRGRKPGSASLLRGGSGRRFPPYRLDGIRPWSAPPATSALSPPQGSSGATSKSSHPCQKRPPGDKG